MGMQTRKVNKIKLSKIARKIPGIKSKRREHICCFSTKLETKSKSHKCIETNSKKASNANHLMLQHDSLFKILLSPDERFLLYLQPPKKHIVSRSRLSVGCHQLVRQCRVRKLVPSNKNKNVD